MDACESDDRPWTEDQWERFMQRSDARSARFGELSKTLRDHPDQEEIIAREMGWDHMVEDRDSDESGDLDDSFDAPEPATDGLSDADWEEISRDRDEVESIEAYSAGYQWGLNIHEALKDYFDAEDEEPDEDLDRVLSCFQVAAKIAGGHGMGYEDDVLCGNIVCCKRALAAADESVEALKSLEGRNVVDSETLQVLIAEGRHVRDLVDSRIEELRSRVWWA